MPNLKQKKKPWEGLKKGAKLKNPEGNTRGDFWSGRAGIEGVSGF